jgi:hypothetical protein
MNLVGLEVLIEVLMESSIFWDKRTTRRYIPEGRTFDESCTKCDDSSE